MTEQLSLVEAARAARVTEAQLEALVRDFYDRARTEPVLGPIFADLIHDFEAHVVHMTDFWSRLVLGTDRYHRCVVSPHMGGRFAPEHFDRWLAVLEQSAVAVLGEHAELVIDPAQQMTHGFKRALTPPPAL
ncbi:group III truncated hemoglobin [Derxia gummosa]|uniref:Group III truncated hemoglobin n=1 Tax=Derxia gummosa DSM 723 TaxID=1121388 RepID=A0A8B6X8B6_9BURK|nr:group III truncated hemoglobin [Derxia gummosa]